jgi:alpha-tubulin suppressor-like RCC1 family protein
VIRTGSRTLFRACLALSVVAAAPGCREDADSPTSPEEPGAPALATGTAAALVFNFVSAGDTHTCGVTTDHRVYCWGHNFLGQLGDGTRTDHLLPAEVLGGLRFRNVSVGLDYTCGVTTGDRAYCWGYGGSGKLGDGTNSFIRPEPTAVAGGHPFNQVRAGVTHTCAITTSEEGYCWGYNSSGQLGDGTHIQRLAPVLVTRELHWRWLSPGQLHTCGVTTDNRAYCFGNNVQGQLGIGESDARSRPRPVLGGLKFRHVEAGYFHTCGVTTEYLAYCWGYDGDGELGNGVRSSPYSSPVAVAGGRQFAHVSATEFHTCGVTLVGRGFCWGNNPRGELGDGTTTSRLTPTALGVSLILDQVSAGESHSCGVTTDGRGYCWGENRLGQIGDGTQIQRLLPVPIAGPT